jgi:hypothetical protein
MGPSPYPHVIAKVPAQLPAAVTPTPMSSREVSLVSVDHFRRELRVQMSRAAKHGSIEE